MERPWESVPLPSIQEQCKFFVSLIVVNLSILICPFFIENLASHHLVFLLMLLHDALIYTPEIATFGEIIPPLHEAILSTVVFDCQARLEHIRGGCSVGRLFHPKQFIYSPSIDFQHFKTTTRNQKHHHPFQCLKCWPQCWPHVDTNPRLPDNGDAKACDCLFAVCEELTGCKYDE